jgi:SAM-dependent methyltransferase
MRWPLWREIIRSSRQLAELKQRLAASEKQLADQAQRLAALEGPRGGDRTVEWALLNVKQLGFDLARRVAETRMRQSAAAPPPPLKLNSSLCTQSDLETDWAAFWCEQMKIHPTYHRKIWEFIFIAQSLWAAGKMSSGSSGLGFGCGAEPLPSLFAKYGVRVLATDLDPGRPETAGWSATGQHAKDREAFCRRDICSDETLLANIDYRPVDMNHIPADLDGRFDFCWSACSLEHLGSIAHGLDFIENSLRTLKPGGIAVHTTEFNLENGETIDHSGTVLYQKRHIEDLVARLRKAGHHVSDVDFNPASRILDGMVDIPPWDHGYFPHPHPHAHLKLCIGGFPCTSIGIVIANE